MFTNRRNQRNRREALFTLESLDDRLVLSATAAAAAAPHAAIVEQRHEAMLARVEARHEARLARVEARHEARLARIEARHEARLGRMIPPPVAPPMTVIGAPAPTVAPPAAASTAPTVATTTTATPAPVSVSASPSSTTETTSGSSTASTGSNSSSSGSTSTSLTESVDANLQALYNEYESAGGGSDFTPSLPSDKVLQISGNSVDVNVKVDSSSSFSSALQTLQADGMQVTASSSTYGLISGMLPISELPAAASVASSVNASPAPVQF